MTDYGWKKEDEKLHIIWKDSRNVTKYRESIDFFLSGCKCKTGCETKICSCRKKERQCGPSCMCVFCNNTQTLDRQSYSQNDLVVEELLEEQDEDEYVDDSEDDLDQFRKEEMYNDDELRTLMEFVFGEESSDDEH